MNVLTELNLAMKTNFFLSRFLSVLPFIFMLIACPTIQYAQGKNGFGGTPLPRMAAIVVGVSEYKNLKDNSLDYADDDALQFSKLLECTQNVEIDTIIPLVNEKATTGNFKSAMYKLGRLAADTSSSKIDHLVVYFSGHGAIGPAEDNFEGYFLMHNSGGVDADTYGLEHRKVINILRNSFKNCSRIYIIADACHAGRFAGNPVTKKGIPQLQDHTLFAGDAERVVEILSSESDKESIEVPQFQHGLFTYYLIRGAEGEAYVNYNGVPSLDKLRTYLVNNMGEEQIPVVKGEGNFLSFDTCLNYSRNIPDKISGSNSGKKKSFSVKSNFLALKVLFDTLIAQGKIYIESDTSAYSVLREAAGRAEYKGIYEDMRSDYIAAVIDENTDIVYRYVNQDILFWNTKFSDIEKGMLMQKSLLELLRPEELLFRNISARYFFFEALAWYEYAKFASGDERVKMLENAGKIIRKSIEAKSSFPTAFFLQFQIDLALNQGADLSEWTSQLREIQKKAPNWRLPYLYERDRGALFKYRRMLNESRLYTTLPQLKMPLLDSLILVNEDMVSIKEITELFSDNPVLAEDLFLCYLGQDNQYAALSTAHQVMVKDALRAQFGTTDKEIGPDKISLFSRIWTADESDEIAEISAKSEKVYESSLEYESLSEFDHNGYMFYSKTFHSDKVFEGEKAFKTALENAQKLKEIAQKSYIQLEKNVSNGDLHIYYDAFRDSVWYVKGGLKTETPVVNKRDLVHLHVVEFNNYLYDIRTLQNEVNQEFGKVQLVNYSFTDSGSSVDRLLKNVPLGVIGTGFSGMTMSEIPGYSSDEKDFSTSGKLYSTFKAADEYLERLSALIEDISSLSVEITNLSNRISAGALTAEKIDYLLKRPDLPPSEIRKMVMERIELMFGSDFVENPTLEGALSWANNVKELRERSVRMSQLKEKWCKDKPEFDKTVSALSLLASEMSEEERKRLIYLQNIRDEANVRDLLISRFMDSLGSVEENAYSVTADKLGALYLKIREVKNYSFEYNEIFQPSDKELELKLYFTSKNKNQTGVDESDIFRVKAIRVVGYKGFTYNFTAGFCVGSFFNRGKKFSVGYNSNQQTIITETNTDNFIPALTTAVQFYFDKNMHFTPGIQLGMATPITKNGSQSQPLNFILGPSLLIGKEQRILVSLGLLGGKNIRLSEGFKPSQLFDSRNGTRAIPTVERFELGWYFGISGIL